MNDDELLDALGEALEPPARAVPADGLAAVRAQAAAGSSELPAIDRARRATSRRTVLVGWIAAAVGAAVGVAGAIATTSDDGAGDDQALPPTRPVDFSEVRTGTTVAGRTIDHTWGMELLLDVDGLPVDHDYAVTFVTATGPIPAGGFRSVSVPMACRFTGTSLRDAVTAITVTDRASGTVVLRGRPV